MDIPKQIIRLATELGLPPGKVSFQHQFAGWSAKVAVFGDALDVWVDRGEFWLKVESEGVSVREAQTLGVHCSAAYEDELRAALGIFRDIGKKKWLNQSLQGTPAKVPSSSTEPDGRRS